MTVIACEIEAASSTAFVGQGTTTTMSTMVYAAAIETVIENRSQMVSRSDDAMPDLMLNAIV